MAFESYFKPFHLVTQNLFQNQTLNSCKIPGFAFFICQNLSTKMESVWISKKISMSIFIIPSLTQKNLCFWLQVYAHISNLVQPKFNQDKMEVLIILGI